MEPTFRSVSQTDERFTHKAAPRVLRSADESTPDAAREGVRWWSSAHGAMPCLQSTGLFKPWGQYVRTDTDGKMKGDTEADRKSKEG